MTAIFAREPGSRAHRLDFDGAVVDFRHFLREQLGHELRPRARQEDLRATLLTAHVIDVGADAIAVADVFARDHFIAADDALGAAKIDDDVAVLGALHRAVDDLAEAVLVFAELAIALGLAHFLHDDLLGVLRGHAAEIQRRQALGDQVADLRFGVAPLGVRQVDLRRFVLDVVDHRQHARKPRLARLRVDLAANVVLARRSAICSLLDRVFHGLDHDLAVDRLLASDSVRNLQKLEPVGANTSHACHLQRSSKSSVFSSSGSASTPSPSCSLPLAFARLNASRMSSSVSTSRAVAMSPIASPIVLGTVFAQIGFDQDFSVFEPLKNAPEALPRFDGGLEFDLRFRTGPINEIGRAHQRAINAGRRDFEPIGFADDIPHVQDGRHGLGDLLAIVDRRASHPASRP